MATPYYKVLASGFQAICHQRSMLVAEGGGYAKRVALAVAEQQGTPPGGSSWHVVFRVTCPCDHDWLSTSF